MAIDIRHSGELALPQGARQLGSRVKPILRLGMGIKDPERGFPRKTDHFTVRGDARSAAKFKEVYGEQPKAVKVMVPSSLPLALDISYRSFIGGGDAEGGRPLALGMTNFAPLGYVGGPDVLRVWRQDGTYSEVETLGLDELGKPLDEIANDLKIEVHATFTFTIPDVLGWGSFCQVTSKGKKTADNLTFKLSEIYSAFGSKAPWAFDRDEPPLLVIKPDTALMRMEKDGEAKWAKTKIFVLDLVIPESFDDMRDRLLERSRELAPDGPVAALYGTSGDPSPDADAVPDVRERSATDTANDGQNSGVASPTAEPVPPGRVSGSAATPDEDVEEGVWDAAPAGPTDEEIAEASRLQVGKGVHMGKTLAQVADDENGPGWLLSALKKPDCPGMVATFVQGRLPDTWAAYQQWLEEQS